MFRPFQLYAETERALRVAYELERDTSKHRFNRLAPPGSDTSADELQRIEALSVKMLREERPRRYWSNYLVARVSCQPSVLRSLGYSVTPEQAHRSVMVCLRSGGGQYPVE